MNAVSLQQAIKSLPDLVQKTIENCEETMIVSDAGTVVLIDQREWENLLETLRLFQDKTSLKSLLDGHQAREAGGSIEAVAVEEAFYDIQSKYPEKCE